jgi:hypothetical protein
MCRDRERETDLHRSWYENNAVRQHLNTIIFKFPIISDGKNTVDTRTCVVEVTLVHITLGPKNYVC